MAGRINKHHIHYDPDWVLELGWLQHKAITNVQQMNSTFENFAKVTNFLHALTHEWNRMRAALDMIEDGVSTDKEVKKIFRGKEMFLPKPKPKIKRRRKK